MKPLSLIVARSSNGVIGRNGRLPWHYSDELQHFSRTTMGHHVIMGWKTYECITTSMPGRAKHVITTKADPPPRETVRFWDNLDACITALQKVDPEPFVIGGQHIFAQAMRRVTRIYLTTIYKPYLGDRWFEYPESEFTCSRMMPFTHFKIQILDRK